MSKLLTKDLFLSSDDSEVESKPVEKKSNKRRSSSKPREEPKVKKTKTSITPYTPPPRLTANDLFGEDSDEEHRVKPSTSSKSGNIPPLLSSFTRRESRGFSKQISETKEGKYYVELKIYNTEEVQKIAPINRWRYAITTIKMKLDEHKDSWHTLKEFVNLIKKDFRNCPVSLLGSYESII
ncbi:uncharacterized protein LOC114354564 [Ostrinia furnacalis]|uniref:uncharacterized protein LOC114354564 n=1 Tax=Ostrinia furnacalis TaxID=93504 RepID=UPI001038A5E3|nr:uncharacterized protein LOC114354564 [Ostrinia furnacalis]